MPRCLALAALLSLLLCAPVLATGDPLRAQQWGLDLVEADAAHAVSTGAGAVVAVVDSGVQADHPDLAANVLPGRDLVDGDATPADGNGHGTHVSGIIAAVTGNDTGVASVAPGASILPVRVLGDDGGGSISDVAAGIDWARERGANVINLSLGNEVPLVGASGGGALDDAIRRALQAGIVVVAAAGNNGVPVCEQPAAAAGLLCVGAVDKQRRRAYYSSFGEGLGVVAPGGSSLPLAGENVLSTFVGGGYEEIAGTSQAAPHVSGVAALLVALGLRGQDAVRRIRATAADLGTPGEDADFGAGLVNARAAVEGLAPAAPADGGEAVDTSGGTSAPAPFVRAARAVSALTLRRRGLRVTVRAAQRGRAQVRVSARGRTLALGSARCEPGRARTFSARLTASGRRLIARSPRGLTARVTVRLPGERRARARSLRIGG